MQSFDYNRKSLLCNQASFCSSREDILRCKKILLTGSPGLGVMGGDSWSEGHGFESHHQILDGNFSHLFVVKIVTFV